VPAAILNQLAESDPRKMNSEEVLKALGSSLKLRELLDALQVLSDQNLVTCVPLKEAGGWADAANIGLTERGREPVRPAGMSATDAEHEAALRRALEIREYLRSSGWPEPIYSDSGNGGHLLYRLPTLDLKSAGILVKRCLMALATRFSDSKVKVDEATANPSRICKLLRYARAQGRLDAGSAAQNAPPYFTGRNESNPFR
jgi:hypothetical protein